MNMSKKKGEKYPPMSEEDIRRDARRQEEAKAKYSMKSVDVESALTEYLEMLDPILWTNPQTKETKAIAWVRRPSMKQLKGLIPPEMAKYMDDPAKVPDKVNKKYEKFFYEKMAEMISIPNLTAEQWKEKSNPWFIREFWSHIANIAKLMEGQIEGF